MKIALVTGASSGIGAAIAIELAEAGWGVMAAGRDETRLEEVSDMSESIATWAGDLDDAETCEELIAETIDEFGQLDCLVNSAGVLIRGTAAETTDDDWRDTMSINLDIPFFLSRAAIPHLVSTAGSIINIASDWGIRAGHRAVSYCVSKGGLIQLTKAMALDHARDRVRVNAICPGDVDTPMLAESATALGMDADEFLIKTAAESRNGRVAEPVEIASLVVYLTSHAARHITGTTISIDGGNTA